VVDFGACLVMALVEIPAGIFWNDGWEITPSRYHLAATLLFES